MDTDSRRTRSSAAAAAALFLSTDRVASSNTVFKPYNTSRAATNPSGL
jgi:hypothetical protein